MGITEDALKKLNKKQLSYCKISSGVITSIIEKGMKNAWENEAGRLKGYLECMRDMDILSEVEVRLLYEYFFVEDRSK